MGDVRVVNNKLSYQLYGERESVGAVKVKGYDKK